MSPEATVRAGLRQLVVLPELLAARVAGAVSLLGRGLLVIGFPLLAVEMLGSGEDAAGLLWACFAAGSMLGALALPGALRRWRAIPAVLGGIGLSAALHDRMTTARQRSGQVVRLCMLVAACGAVMFGLTPVAAHAGTYDVQLCANAATGQGNLGAGETPDGWLLSSNVANWNTSVNCNGPITWTSNIDSKGIRVYAECPGACTAASPGGGYSGVGSTMTFSAAANTTISALSWYRYMTSQDGPWRDPFQRVRKADGTLLEEHEVNNTVGTASVPVAPGNLVTFSSLNTSQVKVELGCGYSENWSCGESSTYPLDESSYTIFGGTITLSDVVSPVVSTPTVTGTGSTRTVSFDATDQGGGLKQAALEVDGAIVDTKPLSAGNNDCATPYKVRVPCDLSDSDSFTRTFAQGTHTIRVKATDVAGNQAFSPSVEITIPPPSDDCDAAGTTVAEGFAGSTYVKLRVQGPDGGRTLVCFRAVNGSSIALGGKFTITGPAVGTPSFDTSYQECSTTTAPPNQIPGEHPIDSGDIGDPNDPPNVHVHYEVDAYLNDDEAWVCLKVGSAEHRVIVPLAGTQTPDVEFEPDAAPQPGEPQPGPIGYPSSTCEAGPGGSHERLLNADLADMHVWAASWQPNASKAHVCTRVEGPASAGGMLTVDAGGLGTTPITVSDDISPCTVNVFSNTNPTIQVKRSPTDAIPASVCVKVEGTEKRFTIDPDGPIMPVAVTWEPDPGTPGGPISVP